MWRRDPWSGPRITPMSRSLPHVRACWLGRTGYRAAWDLQAELVRDLRAGGGHDTLLLLEHPHVFTMGKAASAEHLLWNEAERHRREVEVVWSDRGGEATYHGPGQLVGYPVIDLAHFGITIPEYIATLERSLIAFLAGLGIDSEQGEPGLTGVWRQGEKLAAIGIKLNRSVVSHGFALNLTTDLGYFDGIVPCGHAELRPTSVLAVCGHAVAVEDAAQRYAGEFARAFSAEIAWIPASELVDPAVGAGRCGL